MSQCGTHLAAIRDSQTCSAGWAFRREPDVQSCSAIIVTTLMAITIGSQLGSHEIISLLGKGGMGEVYRARDTKLKREVAIKILPDEFARDADRVSRFQQEAEVLAPFPCMKRQPLLA